MTTMYFGDRWDAPMLDDECDPRQVATPVGDLCMRCRTPIAAGDRGLIRSVIRGTADDPSCTDEPVHTECDLLGVMGHMFGVCRCTGWDTSSRGAALTLLARVNGARWGRGQGPL